MYFLGLIRTYLHPSHILTTQRLLLHCEKSKIVIITISDIQILLKEQSNPSKGNRNKNSQTKF